MSLVRELAEKANAEKSTNQDFKQLVPEQTVNDADGSIEITGFAKNVALKGFEWIKDGAKNYGQFTFQDEEGGSIRKFISEPDRDKNFNKLIERYTTVGLKKNGVTTILSEEEAEVEAKEREQKDYDSLIRNLFFLHSWYFKGTHEVAVDKLVDDSIETTCIALFEDAPFEKARFSGTLKVVFAKKDGQYPKYTVPQYNWFGSNIEFSPYEKDNQLYFKKDTPEFSSQVQNNTNTGFGNGDVPEFMQAAPPTQPPVEAPKEGKKDRRSLL